ncbi:MAG: hypothetical protein E3J72_04245 [Planctomycetota bacterium]|nr:MAG: hypothetical protein E3J72_04245 [Planctomycetota bacterium]
MIELTIDGLPVRAEKGTSVLEAAGEMGIRIPTLCHDPGLRPYGACRMCIVEVKRGNRSKLEASCTLPAQNGQVILTSSPRVQKARKVILELLISSCPNSKTLQDMAANMGLNKIRFKIKDKNCTLCGLCVRYCKEQMASGGIWFVGRGNQRRVAPAFGVMPEECRNCGGCEFICPACSRACNADNLKDGLCGGCLNCVPVETCAICVRCSESVGSTGHKVF